MVENAVTVTAKKTRKGLIELSRFLFAFIVLIHHTHGLMPKDKTDYPFVGGYIAVEFFLILSGFLCTKYCFETESGILPAKMAVSYTAKQFFKLITPVFVSVAVHYAVTIILGKLDLSELPYIVYEIGLLPQSGIYKTFLNLPLWYLSAYIICLPVLLYLVKKSPDFFVNIGAVIVPLIIYGYLCRTHIHVDIWSFDSKMFIGLFRVFAGLCMGVNSYKIYKAFCQLKVKKQFRTLIIAFSIAAILAVVVYCYHYAFTYADYFLILLMTFAIGIIFEMDTPKLNSNKCVTFLGKWSTYIYCSHWTVRMVIPIIFDKYTYNELLPIYFFISLIYSLVVYFISMMINRIFKYVKKKATA